MKELVEYIVKSIVNNPDEVETEIKEMTLKKLLSLQQLMRMQNLTKFSLESKKNREI